MEIKFAIVALSIFLHLAIDQINAYFITGVIAFAFLMYLTFRNLTKGMISEIGINDKYYSKYIKPCKFIAKHFKIKEKHIPKFLYVECFIIIIFSVLYVADIFICILFDAVIISYILFIIKCILILVNFIWFVIMCGIYKKADKSKDKIKNKRWLK